MSAADRRPGLGIGLRLLSGVLFGGMFVSVKAISAEVPVGQMVFFRALFALPPLLLFLWMRGELATGMATKRPGAHLVRAGFGALALFGSFAAVVRLPLAEAILIAQLSPILMALAAMVLLSERLTPWRIWGLVFGFLGVFVLVLPELGETAHARGRLVGYILGIGAAFLSALALIMVRSLAKTESPGAIALYFVLASMMGGLVTLPWGWITPEGSTLWLLVLSGLFGGCAHIAMTLAFRYAEASRLAPFEYVALLWPVLADLFIFRVSLSTGFLFAAPIIVAGAAIAASESQKENR